MRVGHPVVVEGLREGLLVDPLLDRDVAEGAPRLGGLLHDLGSLVVADVGVERGRRREGRLGVAGAVLAVGLDAADQLLVEEARGGGKQQPERNSRRSS